jgi:hypothetical protein
MLLLTATLIGAAPTAKAAGITNLSSHAPPAINLPAAGGSYIDPVFGTKIIRVTDQRAGTHCFHAYSYWPAMNSNDTRLLLACDDVPRLYKFNPATDQVTPDGLLTGTNGPKIQFEGASWSHTNPNLLYAADSKGLRIWAYDVSKRGAAGYTQLVNLTGRVPGGTHIFQMSVSDSGDVFSFHLRNASNQAVEACVWVKSTNRLYVYKMNGHTIDESFVNKTGQYVLVSSKDGTRAIWNYVTGQAGLYTARGQDVDGHYDLGTDWMVNSDGIYTGLTARTWKNTLHPANIVKYLRPNGTPNWSIAEHVSLREDKELFAIGSTYAGDGRYNAFEDEIYLAHLDGHGFVRLAHTRSYERGGGGWKYYAQPRAVVDRLGHYVVYTSDLGSSSRLDVMILKIPQNLWP